MQVMLYLGLARTNGEQEIYWLVGKKESQSHFQIVMQYIDDGESIATKVKWVRQWAITKNANHGSQKRQRKRKKKLLWMGLNHQPFG